MQKRLALTYLFMKCIEIILKFIQLTTQNRVYNGLRLFVFTFFIRLDIDTRQRISKYIKIFLQSIIENDVTNTYNIKWLCPMAFQIPMNNSILANYIVYRFRIKILIIGFKFSPFFSSQLFCDCGTATACTTSKSNNDKVLP